MNLHNLKVIENTDYYIWWLLNCSQNADMEALEKEVRGVLRQVENLFIEIAEITGKREPALLRQLNMLSEIEMPGSTHPDFFQKEKDHQKWMEELVSF
jgi:hypothetical protein